MWMTSSELRIIQNWPCEETNHSRRTVKTWKLEILKIFCLTVDCLVVNSHFNNQTWAACNGNSKLFTKTAFLFELKAFFQVSVNNIYHSKSTEKKNLMESMWVCLLKHFNLPENWQKNNKWKDCWAKCTKSHEKTHCNGCKKIDVVYSWQTITTEMVKNMSISENSSNCVLCFLTCSDSDENLRWSGWFEQNYVGSGGVRRFRLNKKNSFFCVMLNRNPITVYD